MTTLNVASTTARSLDRHVISVAYTPDSDDAFNFYAWEHGKVALGGDAGRRVVQACFEREHIIALNRAALGHKHDVVGISSAIYPSVADHYWILSAGNSVGRGYGPVLVSKHYRTLPELRGKRIAVGGIWTTGAALAAMYCPRAELIEMRYDQIADAVMRDEFDAGVMIHEELLFFTTKGLRAVADLGHTWCEDTRLPLPVGLNLVRRSLGQRMARRIARVCRDSLQWGLDHFDQAFAFASTFGRGCAAKHVELFCNQDTLCLPADVRRAMRVMFQRVADLNMAPRIDDFEVIDADDD